MHLMFTLRRAVHHVLVAGMLSAAVASAVHAQGVYPSLFGFASDPAFANNRALHVAMSGGVAMPAAEFKDRHDMGFHANVALILGKPRLPVRLRAEGSYASFRMNQRTSPFRNLDEISNTSLISVVGNLEVAIARGFYGFAGLGAANARSAFKRDTMPDVTSFGLLYDAGLGYRFAFDKVSGFLEARVNVAKLDEQKFGYPRARTLPIAFGFVF